MAMLSIEDLDLMLNIDEDESFTLSAAVDSPSWFDYSQQSSTEDNLEEFANFLEEEYVILKKLEEEEDDDLLSTGSYSFEPTDIFAGPSQPPDYRSYEVCLYYFNHPIWTTVTSNPTTVSGWISDLKRDYPLEHLLFGFHVEWCPDSEENHIAVIQLCTGNVCLILHSPYIPSALSDLLSDELHTFVGVSVKEKLMRLQKEYGIGVEATWKADLGELAASVSGMDGYKKEGLETLASCVLNIEMEKPVCVHGMSWWDNRFLSVKQINYATQHAFLSFLIAWAFITHSRYY